MKRHLHTWRIALALVLVLSSQHLAADLATHWKALNDEAAQALQAGDFARALKVSDRLVHEMVDSLGAGQAEANALAVAVTFRALAQTGMGKKDEALWDWETAKAIAPAIANTDLTTFGAVAETLKSYKDESLLPAGAIQLGAKITPPKVMKRYDPCLPAGARTFSSGGLVMVRGIIDTEGRVRAPEILQKVEAPTLTYCTFEAVRKWRFKPAEADGKPVSVIYNITMNFKVNQ